MCERFHGPLRTIFKKIRKERPDLPRDLVLQTALKAMNDTIGPEGLVPSLLVYGVTPRYTPGGLKSDLPNNRQRHEAVRVARDEYLRISNNLRIKRVLREKVPESADLEYKVNERVWVYREELKQFVGPMKIVEVDNGVRMVSVEERPGRIKLYSVTKIKPYLDEKEQFENIVQAFGETPGPWCTRFWNKREDLPGDGDYSVNITEVLSSKDPRTRSPENEKGNQG